MNRRFVPRVVVALMLVVLHAWAAAPARACATCFGDPSSPLSQSAILGMSVLLGFIVCVLGAIGVVSCYWGARARRIAAPSAAAAAADAPNSAQD